MSFMIQNITPVEEEKVVIFDSCSLSRECALQNSDAVSSFPFPLISFFFLSVIKTEAFHPQQEGFSGT